MIFCWFVFNSDSLNQTAFCLLVSRFFLFQLIYFNLFQKEKKKFMENLNGRKEKAVKA